MIPGIRGRSIFHTPPGGNSCSLLPFDCRYSEPISSPQFRNSCILAAWNGCALSMKQVKHSAPARFAREMKNYIRQLIEIVGSAGLIVIVARSFKGPVNHQRLPDNVFPGDEPPIAAVGA